MNPLQEKPGLFASKEGKFKVKAEDGNESYILKIHGLDEMGKLIVSDEEGGIWYPPISVCTLIARPIADMTAEEIREFFGAEVVEESELHVIEGFQDIITKAVNSNEISFTDARYLLSIGVLPFPQSLFQDGTVLDSTETEPGRN